MTDEEVIKRAEEVGFKIIKHKDSFFWTLITPDDKRDFVCEQGDVFGMKWLREKLTYFI